MTVIAEADKHSAMLNIRFADLGDVNSIISLFRQSEELHVTGQPDIFSIAKNEEVEKIFEKFLTDQSVVNLVLESNGNIQAYLRYRVSQFPNVSFLTRKGKSKCYIEEIVVDKESRRQGLGKHLLNYLEQQMKDEKVQFIHLHVFAFNQAAHSLYKDLGFELVTSELGKTLDP